MVALLESAELRPATAPCDDAIGANVQARAFPPYFSARAYEGSRHRSREPRKADKLGKAVDGLFTSDNPRLSNLRANSSLYRKGSDCPSRQVATAASDFLSQ